MRLAAEAQLGYYPTPPGTAQILAQAFCPPDDDQPTTAFDPFCGTGDALAAFPASFTMGSDLDDARIREAATRLTHTLHADAWALKCRSKSVGLLLLNPPYTYDPVSQERQERRAIYTFTPWVHPRGYVILIAPRTVVLRERSLIDQHWTVRAMWRFPDSDYAAFGQIILVGQPRHPRDAANDWDQWLTWQRPPTAPSNDWYPRDNQKPTWPRPLPASLSPQWSLPSTPPVRLQATQPLAEQLIPLLAQSSAWTSLQLATAPPPTLDLVTPITTPLTLHRGHLATLLTAGKLTGVIGTGSSRHLVRGRTIPYTVVTQETEEQRVEETRYRIELTTVHPDGTLRAWHEHAADPMPGFAEEG